MSVNKRKQGFRPVRRGHPFFTILVQGMNSMVCIGNEQGYDVQSG